MIKLFRNTRKKLLREGKTANYLKYAIGEIVLVVFGILIALSINNWNEARKEKAEEHKLLTNLRQSFSSKLNELLRKNASRTEDFNNIGQLIKHIEKQPKEGMSEEKMFGILKKLFIWHTVNEEFNVIDMLFSSGKINIISNDSLKTKLIAWPDNMEEMLEEQRVLQDLVTHQLNPLISSYVSSANLLRSFNPNFPTNETLYKSPYPNDFNGLLHNRTFESLVAQKAMYLVTNINDSQKLILEAKSILKLIDGELKNDKTLN